MKSPHFIRYNIPFFYQKTEREFRQDVYERYDEMVVRQTALHLADELWEVYPFQPVLDWMLKHLPKEENLKIVEVGCGVGRLIGSMAMAQKSNDYWGLDYSYQMLRRAFEYWKSQKDIDLDLSARGRSKITLSRINVPSSLVNFGLAKGEDLPFEKESVDVVCSSFLLDRLSDPMAGIKEQYRVLKKGGKLLLITPLNFQKAKHWELFYPLDQFVKQIELVGFSINKINSELIVDEPLDAHGNFIRWNCIGVSAEK